jgi:hypothetical protein
MEYSRDENPLRLHGVQHKVRKAPEQRLACSQCDKLAPFRKTPEALDCSVKREQELES